LLTPADARQARRWGAVVGQYRSRQRSLDDIVPGKEPLHNGARAAQRHLRQETSSSRRLPMAPSTVAGGNSVMLLRNARSGTLVTARLPETPWSTWRITWPP